MNLCAKTIKASGLKLVPLLEKIRDVPEALFAGVFVRFFLVSLVFQIDPHPTICVHFSTIVRIKPHRGNIISWYDYAIVRIKINSVTSQPIFLTAGHLNLAI